MTSRKAWTDKGKKLARALAKAEGGAVAATYALALFALIAIAGVGFDYARLATMDTELQNAADQAALAAATQLDGQSDSITRATTAAGQFLSNNTLLANDGKGQQVVVDLTTITFFETRAHAEAETPTTTDPLKAHFVRVSIQPREAFYALTPVVDAISSGAMPAHATAGLGSAICKSPPVMMCNPSTDPSTVNIDSLVGKGIRLIAGGGTTWAPGNFGFLEANIDTQGGAAALAKALGYIDRPGDCVATDHVTTKPGAMINLIDVINTRFDIYESSDPIGCYGESKCLPSTNARKDLVQPSPSQSLLPKSQCDIVTGKGNKGWQVSQSPYRPTEPVFCSQKACGAAGTQYPDHMGYPRDLCHAVSETGQCGNGAEGRIGNGTWDKEAYMKVNHPTRTIAEIPAAIPGSPTRYEVYRWERGLAEGPRETTGTEKYIAYPTPVCKPAGIGPPNTPDRRVLPVAVINCTGKSGSFPADPVGWMDVFLIEPSTDRDNGKNGSDKQVYTRKGDIYVEVIGRTGQGTGGSAPQFVRRDKPYLVR